MEDDQVDATASFDLLITGGLIIDGSGNPGYYAAVGVRDGEVYVIRGRLGEVTARRTIDATDRVVAPGFIDMHAHSGLVMLETHGHEIKLRQGVTTELIGVDGNSYAPFPSTDELVRYRDLNSGLDGAPNIDYDWTSVDEYLSRYDQAACNIAYLVGNSPVRVCGVGWRDERATPQQLDAMREVTRTAMQEGAVGVSTGLDYPPGSYADTDEIVALCEVAADLGGIYHTHMRYKLGDRFLDPIREVFEIGRRSGIALHITHLHQRRAIRGSATDMLASLDDARGHGLDVTFDYFPYIYGSTRMVIALPQWVQEGGPEETLERLRDPANRPRLREELEPAPRAESWHEIWLTNMRDPKNAEFDGLTIGHIAKVTDRHPVDVICDLIVDEHLALTCVTQSVNGQTLPKYVQHPLSMVGSDALLVGESPSPRTYGSFPLVLGKFAREEGWLTWPDAVRRMTGFPAQRLGLERRGLLRDGYAADIVVFDPQTVDSRSTQSNPRVFPDGIPYVVVNGELAIDAGKRTDVMAGYALRRGARRRSVSSV